MGIRRRRRGGTSAAEPAAGGEGSPEALDAGPSGEADQQGLISGTRQALKPIKKRHVLVASLGIMGVSFAGLLLFSGFSLWWTSQPAFCDKCHVMNKYVDAWEGSSHADANCEHCHLNPGLFSFLGGKISSLQVVANYVTGNYEDYSFNASVTNAACLECHESILEETIRNPESGIIVSHREIIESGGKCMSCHSTVAHGDTVPVGSATYPTMQTCLVCHDDETAPVSDCLVCHIEPPIGRLPEDKP